jgi:putative DNA primase/helicase
VIKGTDYGIWRRIKLIPFTTRIPEERQDKYLEEKLRAEASGIFIFALHPRPTSCMAWEVRIVFVIYL